jgi:hypothetical protein
VLTLHLTQYIKAHPTQGVKANLQLKPSIPIGAKVEISPKGFTLRVKVKILKILSICLKLVKIYGLMLAPRLKKGTI